MSLQKFKLVLETVSLKGSITDDERNHLYTLGKKAKLDQTSVDIMIESHLSFARSSTTGGRSGSGGSGFTTDSPVTDSGSGFTVEKNNSSGFEAPQSGSGFESSSGSASESSSGKFINEKILDSQGNMSTVSEARRGNRNIIIKRLKPNVKDFGKHLELLYKEFDFLASLQHDNIVMAIDKGEDEKGHYYFMEKVSGETLKKRISGRKLSVEEISDISIKVLDALKYLHDKGIIHRDLKPENIMYNEKTSKVKLIDLGLAYSDEFTDNLSKPGTPEYMAPEMKEGKEFDKTTDIYAFGLTLLEMFTKETNQAGIPKVKSQGWQNIITKCLNPQKRLRYQYCHEISDEIRKLGFSKNASISSEKIEKKVNDLLDKFFLDGMLNKEEESLLFRTAEDLGYSADMLKTEISRRKKEAAMKLWEERVWLWVVLLFATGFVTGIVYCILEGEDFWSYLWIPIIWGLASSLFTIILNLISKKTERLPMNFHPATVFVLIILYGGLTYLPFIPDPSPTNLCLNPDDCISKNLFAEARMYAANYPGKKRVEVFKRIVLAESASLVANEQYDEAFATLSVINLKDKDYPALRFSTISNIINGLLCKEIINSGQLIKYLSEIKDRSPNPAIETQRRIILRDALLILLNDPGSRPIALDFIGTFPSDQKFDMILGIYDYLDDRSLSALKTELSTLFSSSINSIPGSEKADIVRKMIDYSNRISVSRKEDSRSWLMATVNSLSLLEKQDKLNMNIHLLKTAVGISPFLNTISSNIAQEIINNPGMGSSAIDEIVAVSNRFYSEYSDTQAKFLIDQAIGMCLYLDQNSRMIELNMLVEKCLMMNYTDLAGKAAGNLPEKVAKSTRLIEIKKGVFTNSKARYDEALGQLIPGEEIEPYKGGGDTYTVTLYYNPRAEARRQIRVFRYTASQRSRPQEATLKSTTPVVRYIALTDSRYIGESSSGRPSGAGVSYNYDGTRFAGTFKNGIKDGKGILYLKDVTHIEGEWSENLLQGSVLKYNQSGEAITLTYKNGVLAD